MPKVSKKDIDFLTHLYKKTKTDPKLKKRFKDFKDFCEKYISEEARVYESITGNKKNE